MNKGMLLIFTLLLSATAAAVQVGVVVEYPEGTVYTECAEVGEDANGYQVVEKTGLDVAWNFDPTWGHGMCGIEGVGCPAENCWCAMEYWGFYVMAEGESGWTYSAVGFDGGSTCAEHYCAKNGDVLGFAYGGFGTKPTKKRFEEVCGQTGTDYVLKRRYERKYYVDIFPGTPHSGETITVSVSDEEENPLQGAEVEAYEGKAGLSKQAYSGKTDRDGKTSFSLEEGAYEVRVNAGGYHPSQSVYPLVVYAKPTTTTTTTSTTTTTEATTTSRVEATSSTTAASTTTSSTSTSATSTTSLEPPTATGHVVGVEGYGILSAMAVLLSVTLYSMFKERKT